MSNLKNLKNLKKLLEDNKVEIPMLQRDYAQGRASQNQIANEFLDSIFGVLDGTRESLHIDFIYGYKEDKKFLLIDGQQRITTLWLLHFYLYKYVNSLEKIEILLEKFSYNMRKSSKNFCKNLLKENFDISKKPSDAIKAKGGEFETAENLNNDPTIKAMLHMLDLIFERIQKFQDKGIEIKVEKLDDVTFDLFNMGEFGLGEELYIKMNARGKQLSKYENLKSFIEKDSRVSKDCKLLENIDTKWSDYFFDSRHPDNFDKVGCNFLHYATLFFTLEDYEELQNIKEIINNPNQPVNEFYEPLRNPENIKLLDKVVELCALFDELKITEALKIKSSSFFVNSNKESLIFSDICYFFSILFFVKENLELEKINKAALNDYLRVCRHFIENHRLDTEEHIHQFFKLFEHLSKGHSNIYQFLKDSPVHNFHSNIYSLEVKKAKLILDSREGRENWEEILDKTSEHEVLKGWVDFLLDFSDEKNSSKNPNFEKFSKYANITMVILSNLKDEKFLCQFQRAFLCFGNFSFCATNYFYGNSPTGIFRDREAMNWLLSGAKKEEENERLYFKEFLDVILDSQDDVLSFNQDFIFNAMGKIIDNCDLSKKTWWEQLLIGEEGLFDFLNERKETFQRYRRIRYFYDVDKVELLPASKSTTNVRDLLDYGFYCYCKKRYCEEQSKYHLTPYECSEKQYGTEYELQSHFSLNKIKVLCKSTDSKILFGDQEYSIALQKGSGIFNEFDRILKLIEEKLGTQ